MSNGIGYVIVGLLASMAVSQFMIYVALYGILLHLRRRA